MKHYFTNENGGALVYVLLIIFSLAIFMPVVFSQLSQDRSQVIRLTNEVQVNQVLNSAMNSYLENNEILQSLCNNENLYLPDGEKVTLKVTTQTMSDMDLSCQTRNQAYKVVMKAFSGDYSESLTHMVVNSRRKLPPWIYVEDLGNGKHLICGFTPKGTNQITFDIRDEGATQWASWDSVASFTMLSDSDIRSRLEESDIAISESNEQDDLLSDLKQSFGSYLFFLNYQYGQSYNIEYTNAKGGVAFGDFKPNFNFYAFTKEYSATSTKILGATSNFIDGDKSDRMTSYLNVTAANGNAVIRIGPDGEIEYKEMKNSIDQPADETLIVTNSVDFTNTDKENISLSAGEVVIQDLASLTVANQSNPTFNITSKTGNVVIQGSLRNNSTSNSQDSFTGISIQSAQDIDARGANLFAERRIEFNAVGEIFLQKATLEYSKNKPELMLYAGEEKGIYLQDLSVIESTDIFDYSGNPCGILKSGDLAGSVNFGTCQ
ncbi:hypothetical protein [Pontibacillus sp. HMF3514]|uniref:hypothetical protein n=1 Tax=Pontibacillus sp. HMF3514 TaxID=2692425 RepID=UPI0013205224|nr:hypothetical protein [Pontibacillus sp. HMF3514]QHE53151.1 hypothetical protein GS400_14480 [Pontibacillus sp. HMF3514]